MCGIAAVVESSCAPALPEWPLRRAWSDTDDPPAGGGALPPLPDLLATLSRRGPDASASVSLPLPVGTLHLLAATLSLRASTPPPHPHPSGPGLLLYNGELYTDADANDSSEGCENAPSDTAHLAALLAPLLAARAPDAPRAERAALAALDALRGPWAVVAWAPAARRLYFARDPLGRRSLLLAAVPGVGAVVASAVPRGAQRGCAEVPPLGLCYMDLSGVRGAAFFGCLPRPSRLVSPRQRLPPAAAAPGGSGGRRRRSSPELERSFVPEDMSRERQRGAAAAAEAVTPSPEAATCEFVAALERAVVRRLVRGKDEPAPAVLFSGGLDSLLIAALLDRNLPAGAPLDLVTVAFGADAAAISACPDRASAVAGLEDLEAARARGGRAPRATRLICVDVAPAAADAALAGHVRHLVHPAEQLMDASIGTALWLAAGGAGYAHGDGAKACVTTGARVLLSGLGADELAGGYKGRHRASHRAGGAAAVEAEVDAEVGRLWARNLGRDDRVVADRGRELRHPFLDEDVVRLVTRLPLGACVCDLGLPDGVGDKMLVRRAARSVGLPAGAAARRKRAMQFGSRSKHVLERRAGGAAGGAAAGVSIILAESREQ